MRVGLERAAFSPFGQTPRPISHSWRGPHPQLVSSVSAKPVSLAILKKKNMNSFNSPRFRLLHLQTEMKVATLTRV
ncbi:hypothetical protein CEXT_196301 [Caerostris extrusa]|uniref:Uncharacterized protein n=1 Tax=Caerostris extrusa TaxID=172846 RepID=A0AAV4VJT6_CAEEX|nr:hypothetical protein CEXT_196301 [Caerostris extrusa]